MGKAVVRASEDRAVPATFVGKLEPNYYCRGWNEKRQKYCRARAGAKTTHPRAGRCNMHGGVQENDGRLRTGRYRYNSAAKIQQLMQQHADDPDPLNVLEDLAVLRAALELLLDKTPEEGTLDDRIKFTDAIRGAVDAISQLTHRIEKLKLAGAVSLDQVKRFLGAVDRVLQLYIDDEKLRARMRRDIYAIRV